MFGLGFLTPLMTATLGSGTISTTRAAPPPTVDPASAGRLLHLLRFAPKDTQMVEYGNLIGLKRAIGAEIADLDDVPVPSREPDGPLTPRQEIGQAWWWDFWGQIPKSRVVGNERTPPAEWDRLFGFNLFDVDFVLQAGDPPGRYSVIEGSIDPTTVGKRLRARGFSRALSPLNQATAFYVRVDDDESRLPDEANRYALASLSRIIAAQGVLIAAPTTSVICRSVRAVTGRAPSLADDPAFALLATTMDDPTLLPGTALLGATLLGQGAVDRLAVTAPSPVARAHEPSEQARDGAERALATPRMMPYTAAGLGYRRGAGLGERYWVFTLRYPDEASARDAGAVLVDRVSRYRSRQAGGPLLGTYVDDVLPPVVRVSDAGATVSLLLRAKARREASWLLLFGMQDLGFLTVEQVARPSSAA